MQSNITIRTERHKLYFLLLQNTTFQDPKIHIFRSKMDSLIKQMRKKSAGGEFSETSRQKKIPLKKSVSFKEEKKKKKSPNWLKKQMSGTDNDDPMNDLEDHTAVVAVAAAAYAITNLEETWNQTHSGYELETAMRRTKSKSKSEDILPSKKLSGHFSFKESDRSDDNKPPELKSPGRKRMEKSPSSSMRKIPTFTINLGGGSDTNKQTKDSEDKSKKPVSPVSKPSLTRTRSDRIVPPPPPPPPPPPKEIKKQSPVRPIRSDDSAADAWEKAELAKIKERFEKLNRKIDTWEAKKRNKARRKLDKTERELDQKRKRALERFREDTEYIDQIASGARAQVEKQRRNEETKVKEKADIIRRTGQLPAKTCLCF